MKTFFISMVGIILGIIVGCAFMYFLFFKLYFPPKVYAIPNVSMVSDRNKISATDNLPPEKYMCDIIGFYENMTTILYSTIGIILGVGFIYMYTHSKLRAEEMAGEALNADSFKIKLSKLLEELFNKSKSEGDVGELFKGLEEMDDRLETMNGRLEFIEKAVTDANYNSTKRIITE